MSVIIIVIVIVKSRIKQARASPLKTNFDKPVALEFPIEFEFRNVGF